MSRMLFIDIPTYEIKLEKAYLCKLRLHLVAEELIARSKSSARQWVQGSNDFTRGLLTMASYLESRGHEIGYFRYDFHNKEALLQAAAAYKIIGITAMTPLIGAAIEVATAIKKIDETKRIILGGFHATFLSESILSKYECVDVVVRGEGEATIAQLLEATNSLECIHGITFRDKDGSIVVNDSRSDLKINDLPNPLYSLLDNDLDSYRFNISTARGCSYHCAFCANNPFWGSERYRSLDRVIEELDYLSQRLQPGTLIHFSDNIFTKNRERTIDLCSRIVERNYPFFFSCDIRGRYMDKELAQLLEHAGFVRVSIGFEDADNYVLRVAQKGLVHEANVISAEVIRKHTQMLVNAYWMIALPGSSRQSLEYNIEIVRELIRSNIVNTVNSKLMVLYPGTPFFQRPREFGIRILHWDWRTYDRRLYPPMYRLEALTEKEIYHFFLALEDVIIEEYCRKLDLDVNDLMRYPVNELYRHTAARYVNPHLVAVDQMLSCEGTE